MYCFVSALFYVLVSGQLQEGSDDSNGCVFLCCLVSGVVYFSCHSLFQAIN